MNLEAVATTRTLTSRDLAYDRLGDRFRESLSEYDTQRRIETLIDEFLSDVPLADRRVLEVGTGLGDFARQLKQRGADLTATDIAPSLVERVRHGVGCQARVADALRLTETFEPESFDLVLSSECIEHTPNPKEAVIGMTNMLRPGGLLVLSTPNIIWQPVVRLASRLRLRAFDGLENFSSWRGLRRLLNQQGMTVLKERGLHLFPFQLKQPRLSRWCDDHLQCLRGFMINICLLARKR